MKTEKDLKEKGLSVDEQELGVAIWLALKPKEKALKELYWDFGDIEGNDYARRLKEFVALMEARRGELGSDALKIYDKARSLLNDFGDYLKEAVTNTDSLKEKAEYAYDYDYSGEETKIVEYTASMLEGLISEETKED